MKKAATRKVTAVYGMGLPHPGTRCASGVRSMWWWS